MTGRPVMSLWFSTRALSAYFVTRSDLASSETPYVSRHLFVFRMAWEEREGNESVRVWIKEEEHDGTGANGRGIIG